MRMMMVARKKAMQNMLRKYWHLSLISLDKEKLSNETILFCVNSFLLIIFKVFHIREVKNAWVYEQLIKNLRGIYNN